MSRYLPYIVRPIDPFTPWPRRRRSHEHVASRFRSGWTSTRDLIDAELRMLWAERWILQVDVGEGQINRDGTLSARATPASPGVRISFTAPRRGELLFSADQYLSWQDNVRAVALTLAALRQVDRHGVAETGEQYRGWQALPARAHTMTREQAAEFIAYQAGAEHGEAHAWAVKIATDPKELTLAYRLAARRVHPDVVRDDGDTMARLNAARDLLLGERNAA